MLRTDRRHLTQAHRHPSRDRALPTICLASTGLPTHNDGDVAAVMDDDDFVMEGEGDEASGGWCFGVSSMCAVLGSTGSLLLDSGNDEHLCSPKFADLIPTDPDRSLLKLKDVQQNDLTISGQQTVPLLVGPLGGRTCDGSYCHIPCC